MADKLTHVISGEEDELPEEGEIVAGKLEADVRQLHQEVRLLDAASLSLSRVFPDAPRLQTCQEKEGNERVLFIRFCLIFFFFFKNRFLIIHQVESFLPPLSLFPIPKKWAP